MASSHKVFTAGRKKSVKMPFLFFSFSKEALKRTLVLSLDAKYDKYDKKVKWSLLVVYMKISVNCYDLIQTW